MPPYRKPDLRHGGMQVRICGKTIQKEGNIVCSLPPSKHIVHATIANNDKGDVFAFCLTPDGDVHAWRIVEAPE